ncbi:MAG: YbaB/EbfC family nucleoid-associated protein [Treponema sp.]|jgi:DNA-binding YbaB/EbfC family protein|nr:YbaB/EbfC family nucleoid-associated protein [Treponema sp.]
MNINPFDILKNAQKIQQQMSGLQEKLETITTTGASGGGMVEIDVNGKLEITAVRIATQIIEGGDVEMLQDLIMAAFSDSMAKIREAVNNEVGTMAGGLNLPGFPSGLG